MHRLTSDEHQELSKLLQHLVSQLAAETETFIVGNDGVLIAGLFQPQTDRTLLAQHIHEIFSCSAAATQKILNSYEVRQIIVWTESYSFVINSFGGGYLTSIESAGSYSGRTAGARFGARYG